MLCGAKVKHRPRQCKPMCLTEREAADSPVEDVTGQGSESGTTSAICNAAVTVVTQ